MMNDKQWIAIAVGAFIVGILFGYAIWGPRAARLGEAEKELAAVQTQAGELKKKMADTEANMGKLANEKLSMEKEMAEMKDAMEKASKTKRR
jgi:peptidoglycan hydrolase CwlO-like protein